LPARTKAQALVDHSTDIDTLVIRRLLPNWVDVFIARVLGRAVDGVHGSIDVEGDGAWERRLSETQNGGATDHRST
jgi:hypothetical protein